MKNKMCQACSKKLSSNKPFKSYLSWEERNIENNFLEELVKRLPNDKAESNNNRMVYG